MIIMLLIALNPDNPYGYYILLRLICCTAYAYLAFQALKLKKEGWVWIFCVIAIVYNPIIYVHLTREIWSIVNIVTIGVAIVSIFVLKTKKEEK